jgi:hypothetical protein
VFSLQQSTTKPGRHPGFVGNNGVNDMTRVVEDAPAGNSRPDPSTPQGRCCRLLEQLTAWQELGGHPEEIIRVHDSNRLLLAMDFLDTDFAAELSAGLQAESSRVEGARRLDKELNELVPAVYRDLAAAGLDGEPLWRLWRSGDWKELPVVCALLRLLWFGLPNQEQESTGAPAIAPTEQVKKKEPSDPADGPEPPDRFRWKGKVVKELTRDQYHLLECLWDEDKLTPVALKDLEQRLYADRTSPLKDPADALRKIRERTQDKLEAANLRLTIDRTNDMLRLLPLPD